MLERKAHSASRDSAYLGFADEESAEASHAIHHRHVGKAEACGRTEQDGFQRNVMENIGIELAEKAPEFEDGGETAERREAPAAPGERVRDEALLLDGRPSLRESRCHMHFVACRLCRTGHGQPVRQEVPILGDYVEKAGG